MTTSFTAKVLIGVAAFAAVLILLKQYSKPSVKLSQVNWNAATAIVEVDGKMHNISETSPLSLDGYSVVMDAGSIRLVKKNGDTVGTVASKN